jgi:hypothetical protein
MESSTKSTTGTHSTGTHSTGVHSTGVHSTGVVFGIGTVAPAHTLLLSPLLFLLHPLVEGAMEGVVEGMVDISIVDISHTISALLWCFLAVSMGIPLGIDSRCMKAMMSSR